MAEFSSALFAGTVMHHRFRPKRHRFVYRVFSICLDLDELPQLDSLRFFSINRFNLFSFREKDHGQGGKSDTRSLRQQITELLDSRGYSRATHRIRLLCYPRILGYAFNPLSVYFCYDHDEQLQVILYEVSNTFGQRHNYLLEAGKDTQRCVRHACDKHLYVSPFMPMDTRYHFRITPPQHRVAVCIRQTQRELQDDASSGFNSGDALLHATFTGQYTQLSDRSLVKMFFSYPLMTLKVVGAIHWEALKLWRKGLSLQPRTVLNRHSISWQDKEGVHHYESL
ncbi:MAG: DUF1365 domain-containing protein [Motiliproteus sp.]|nr:DUF1365 domain-containing protein [Motiliproteus sp.]